ncbi:hypothetical protein HK101_005040 [Irineochytrium annulatum]|nr:hypothetical protein HK101_005040 [Irineochytrium annulatum]
MSAARSANAGAAREAASSLSSAPSSTAASAGGPAANAKPIQVKLVLLGEAAVGKSSLVLRFVNNEFQENKEPTIGAAFLTQKCRFEDKVIKFEIWDTAGQERFHSLAPMYYRNAQAAIVAYDITKPASLDKAKTWVKELQRQANPNIIIALVGNKLDLVANRAIPTDEAQAYADEEGLLFAEASAKSGDYVMEVFTDIAKKIPLEHLMASRSRAGLQSGAGGNGTGTGAGRVDLNQDPNNTGAVGQAGPRSLTTLRKGMNDDGYGSVGVWGFCPAIDLQESIIDTPEEREDDAKFLLVGCKDARHIIKTVALAKRHRRRKTNFYVTESQAPLLARTVLLFSLFFDTSDGLSVTDRAQMFLEVFGNTRLRQKTFDTVAERSKTLSSLLCDSDGIFADSFDFSRLKYRERDDIDLVWKFWRNDKIMFNIDALWEYRLRNLYKERFDNRMEVIDWDYHIKLAKRTKYIQKPEFTSWRSKGTAFSIRSAPLAQPNRTMATVDIMKVNGSSATKWGYFNDVVMGPFANYGVTCEDPEMLKTRNDAVIHDDLKVTLLSCDSSAVMSKLESQRTLFDAVYLSSTHLHKLPDSSKLIKDGGVLYVESARFILEVDEEKVLEVGKKVEQLARENGLTPKQVDTDGWMSFVKAGATSASFELATLSI